jgi:addiction module RelE/StbE family toxin
MNVAWTPYFSRLLQKLIKAKPEIKVKIENVMQKLAMDPYDPSLKTHKLKGPLSDAKACSIDYEYRIVFKFMKNNDETEILLIDIGTHEEVY